LELVHHSQCFPLYYYTKNEVQQGNLFDTSTEDAYTRRDAISDYILSRAHVQYGNRVTKEDIFYYVYGFLHSPSYRSTFASDLKKMLPRLPLVEEVDHFWTFSKVGRALSDLHLNYEQAPRYPGVIELYSPLSISDVMSQSSSSELSYVDYRVDRMRFPVGQRAQDCPSTIIYNSHITLENIPSLAYSYHINGKSALEWVMERYALTTHKESQISNDPNAWSNEHTSPRYILDLLHSVITVSLRTIELVKTLPSINLRPLTFPAPESFYRLK
jgi:predicted helicase